MTYDTTPASGDALIYRRTRLALSWAAKDLIEYGLGLMATFGEEGIAPASDVLMACRLMALSRRYKALAVICSIVVRGASWAEVAAADGRDEASMFELYGEVVDRWLRGDPAPWAPPATELFGALPIHIDGKNLAKVARTLDAFYAQNTENRIGGDIADAVSGELV